MAMSNDESDRFILLRDNGHQTTDNRQQTLPKMYTQGLLSVDFLKRNKMKKIIITITLALGLG